jgi:putative two-component system response regulator
MERIRETISAPKICLDEIPGVLRLPAASELDRKKPVEDETEAILLALARAVEQRDKQTAGHCERLAYTSMSIGIAMGLDRADLIALHRGGYLHDIGKVGVPDSILFKPGKLTSDEWTVMRSHTVKGEEICCHLGSLARVLPIIRSHHEKWDGTGYPDHLRCDQIPLLARILQVADIYDALTSERPYKEALPAREALAIIEHETDRGWRDPVIVDLFFKMHKEMFSKLGDDFTAGRNLENLRVALSGLQQQVA